MFYGHGFAQSDFLVKVQIFPACNSYCNCIFLRILSLLAIQTFVTGKVFANCMSAICKRADKLKITSAGGSLLGSWSDLRLAGAAIGGKLATTLNVVFLHCYLLYYTQTF